MRNEKFKRSDYSNKKLYYCNRLCSRIENRLLDEIASNGTIESIKRNYWEHPTDLLRASNGTIDGNVSIKWYYAFVISLLCLLRLFYTSSVLFCSVLSYVITVMYSKIVNVSTTEPPSVLLHLILHYHHVTIHFNHSHNLSPWFIISKVQSNSIISHRTM